MFAAPARPVWVGLRALLALIPLVAAMAGARAEPEEGSREAAVKARARPELDPLGIRVRSFILYPSLTVGLDYQDNLFRLEKDREDSLIARTIPAFRLSSDWNNHSLELSGSLDVGRSIAGEREHFTDGAIGAAGRLDVRGDTQLFGAALFERVHEDRGSPELAGTGAFSSLQRLTANLGVQHRWSRWSALLEGRFTDLDFGEAETPDGERFDNDERDRDVYVLALRLGYEVLPGYEVFLRATGNERAYRSDRDAGGIERDSGGYEAAMGIAVDLTALLTGEAYAGYREQRYRDATLPSVGGGTFGARLIWNASPLTTVQFSVGRDIEDTNLGRGSGFFDTAAQVTVDHELMRNLVLSGAAGYNWQDYRGIDREDEVARGTLSVSYLASRYVTLTLVYDYEERQSSGSDPGPDYRSNRIVFKIVGHR